ncbi:hypothetical protein ACFSKL_17445 [Belliella marina]|uniref:TonB C-terminal domain-containing protein n=1 Tax=Belliella marina TaxID=1644146 RepID=A0ABW4VR70_9BACT
MKSIELIYSMKINLILLFCISILFSCNVEKEKEPAYLRYIGDIEFDPEIDDPDFKLCYYESSVFQYFSFSSLETFVGEKEAIDDYFKENYKPVDINESGWIRIRFIVNCNGETGRFRMIESDEDYKERPFNTKISSQLMALTKSLEGWQGFENEEHSLDYYQYLVFKINNGAIEQILP